MARWDKSLGHDASPAPPPTHRYPHWGPAARSPPSWAPILCIPAWFFLGGWFLYQFFESNYALIHPSNTGGSDVAFFAHVGGFVFGAAVTRVLAGAGRVTIPAARWSPT